MTVLRLIGCICYMADDYNSHTVNNLISDVNQSGTIDRKDFELAIEVSFYLVYLKPYKLIIINEIWELN